MGRYYDENYDLLRQKLREMLAKVQEMITRTVAALTNQDAAAARDLITMDESVDHLEVEIDELIIKLLALQQPMAVDLRFLVTALKVNNDLERMGDQAVNIAETVIRLYEKGEQGTPIIDLTTMEQAVLRMMHESIEAFNNADADTARSVLKQDDAVDEMHHSIARHLADHALKHPEDADRCISLLLVSRNLERIADLSTNIAEDVVYYTQGRFIKHAPPDAS